jgi:uncharacterized membrane protein YgdD (TMEM256/DUF423 family)
MIRLLAVAGALFGLLAVLLGAFGAHGLEGRVSAERIAVWTTGAHYLAWHAPALLALAALAALGAQAADSRLLRAAGLCLIAGGVVFSGSLFVLVLTGTGAWGMVTPIGGMALAAGWALAAAALWRCLPGRR